MGSLFRPAATVMVCMIALNQFASCNFITDITTNLNRLKDSVGFNPPPAVTCWMCESLVGAVRILLKHGLSHELIGKEIRVGCSMLHIEAADVCTGVMNEFGVCIIVIVFINKSIN